MGQASIKKNYIMNALLTGSSFFAALIMFLYVSRTLLPEGIGKVSFSVSFVAYFNMLAQLGIPTYGVRACARVRDDREELSRTAQELVILNLIMALVAYAGLGICTVFLPRVRAEKTLFMIVSSSILLDALGMEWLFRALEQYTYITLRSIAFRLAAIGVMFLLIHSREDYMIYGGVLILATSAPNFLNLFRIGRFISLRPLGNYRLRRHLKLTMAFFAMTCATTVYTNLDTVMLGFMTSETQVGYYSAAVKIKSVLLSLITALGTVMLPRVSYLIDKGEREEFDRITKKALHFVMLLAAPMSVYFILFAREGILILSGKAFAGAVLPMQIIMPTLVLIGITNVLGIQMLVPLGREKVVLRSVVVGAVTDVILNALLIPRFAAAGAAVGTVTAELIVLWVQYAALKSEVGGAFRAFPYWRVSAALVLASSVSLCIKLFHLQSFAALLLSGIFFFGVYGLFLLKTGEPLLNELWRQLLRHFLSRKK